MPSSAATAVTGSIAEAIQHQLNRYLKEIWHHYRRYVLYIRESVMKKNVTVENLLDYLLYLPEMKYHNEEEKHELIPGKREKLKEAKTIPDIFLLLYEEWASFINYEIFQSIATEYKINEDCDELNYPEHLKAYFKKHTIADLAKVFPMLEKEYDPSKREITCKVNVKKIERFAEISDLKHHIADILGMDVVSLELKGVNDGCVIVIFLVPVHIADAIVARGPVFTPKQVERLQVMKIIWLKCGDNCLYESHLDGGIIL